MYCRNCGSEVHPKAVACPKCGVPPQIEKLFCPECGSPTKTNQVICTQCGISLANIAAKESIKSSNFENIDLSSLPLSALSEYKLQFAFSFLMLISTLTPWYGEHRIHLAGVTTLLGLLAMFSSIGIIVLIFLRNSLSKIISIIGLLLGIIAIFWNYKLGLGSEYNEYFEWTDLLSWGLIFFLLSSILNLVFIFIKRKNND